MVSLWIRGPCTVLYVVVSRGKVGGGRWKSRDTTFKTGFRLTFRLWESEGLLDGSLQGSAKYGKLFSLLSYWYFQSVFSFFICEDPVSKKIRFLKYFFEDLKMRLFDLLFYLHVKCIEYFHQKLHRMIKTFFCFPSGYLDFKNLRWRIDFCCRPSMRDVLPFNTIYPSTSYRLSTHYHFSTSLLFTNVHSIPLLLLYKLYRCSLSHSSTMFIVHFTTFLPLYCT